MKIEIESKLVGFIFGMFLFFIILNVLLGEWKIIFFILTYIIFLIILSLLSILLNNNKSQFICEFKSGFKDFGKLLGKIVNSILLTIVYFIGIGLTALFARIVRKKFLQIKPNKKEHTYWEPIDKSGGHYKQF